MEQIPSKVFVLDPDRECLRVIDACVKHLYDTRGVRVEIDGVVHRLGEHRDNGFFGNRTGWFTLCDLNYGQADGRLETRDPITCVQCAADKRW